MLKPAQINDLRATWFSKGRNCMKTADEYHTDIDRRTISALRDKHKWDDWDTELLPADKIGRSYAEATGSSTDPDPRDRARRTAPH